MRRSVVTYSEAAICFAANDGEANTSILAEWLRPYLPVSSRLRFKLPSTREEGEAMGGGIQRVARLVLPGQIIGQHVSDAEAAKAFVGE